MERMQQGNFQLFGFWSFQAFSFLSSDFKSDVSVILNFSSDHLDWHSSEEEYLNSKLKIFGFPHLSGHQLSMPTMSILECELNDTFLH